MINGNEKHLKSLLRHVKHVSDSCELLGQQLIDAGEEKFGRTLICNGRLHDASKFSGIEWKYLRIEIKEKDPEKFTLAQEHHVKTNFHHQEYWSGIQNMPTIFVAEMVADWFARSNEFGTDIKQWVDEITLKRFKLTKKMKKYQEIKKFLGLLLEEPFK